MRWLLTPLFVALSVVAVRSSEQAPAQTSVKNYTSVTVFGDYDAREAKSLDDIPAHVRRKLHAHLLDRLGESYLARLTFAGGQIVDHDEFYRVERIAKDMRWTVFAYSLFFRLTAPDKGIEEYFARIELGKNGNVTEEIELPPVRRLPLKQSFIPLSQAYTTAAKNKFNPARTGARLAYNRKIESIVYQLTENVSRNPSTDRQIEIDAHSGRVIGIRKVHWSH